MKKIWIDVTTTIKWWRGHPTGVQRVVYNYARRFKDSPEYDARLMVLEGGAFREMSFEDFESAILLPVVEDETVSFGTKIKRLPSVIRGNGLAFTKRVVRKMPVVGPAAAAGYKGARKMYRQIKGVEESQDADCSILAKEDIVLLMDGNWGDKGYFANEIVKARQKIGFRLVHVVHDMLAVINPAYASPLADSIIGGYFTKVLPAVDDLACVSQSTLDDVVAFAKKHKLTLTKNRSVIRLGETQDICPTPEVKTVQQQDFVMPEEFILCVGTIEIRKNHHALYYAYKLAAERDIRLPALVVVGKKGWMVEETLYMLEKDADLQGKVQVVWADDATRDKLYKHCLFTVQPSFYEGWGLPVVESLRHGKVCLAANVSSLPEAGGELADYFSPFDTNELLQKMQEYLVAAKRKEREKYIAKTYGPVSWQQSFEQFAHVITEPVV